MTTPAPGAGSAADLPDYAPVPRSALGPALNDQGYYVGRVERNLYWVTDGILQSAFLTTRDDVTVHQQYMADIVASVRTSADTVDVMPYLQKYGENTWAAMKGMLDEIAATAAAPVEKYTGVLAAADVFTESTTFQVMQSIRLDLGYGFDVHP